MMELSERVAVLEAEMDMLKEDLREMKQDIRWIRENMAKRDEVIRLSKRVNGISMDVAEQKGETKSVGEYVKLLIQWALQGGVVGTVVYLFTKML